jgi:hypothetical protein
VCFGEVEEVVLATGGTSTVKSFVRLRVGDCAESILLPEYKSKLLRLEFGDKGTCDVIALKRSYKSTI